MGPSACTRVAEITSGRAISQQGLAATCKDPARKAEAEARGGFWSGAWARISCEGGATPSEVTFEVSPTVGNARGGRRSPGYSAVAARERRGGMAGPRAGSNSSSVWTMSRPGHDSRCWDEETGKPTMQGVYACQRLSLGVVGQARDLTNECRAEVRTGLGKADRPGSQRGFGKRGRLEAGAPRGARVRLLSRHWHVRFLREPGTAMCPAYLTKVRISTPSTVRRRCRPHRLPSFVANCESRRSACCPPDPRRPASAPRSRSRGRAAILTDADLAPGPDDR